MGLSKRVVVRRGVDRTTMGGFGIQIGSGVLHGGIGLLGEYQKKLRIISELPQ